MHHYERTQNFNIITKFLHSTRYRNLKKIIKSGATQRGVLNIVDVGCGPAKSYEVIKGLDIDFQYLGIEVERDFCSIATERYGHFDNFKIACDSIENVFEAFETADIIIGLESFEHIPESLVVRTVEAIGRSDFLYLYVTVPNEVGPAILIKNVGSFLMGYRRYKEYRWNETFAAAMYNLDKVDRHGTGHKGFDWRWLAQTLRQNCKIKQITTSPFQIVPQIFSPSIGFICENDES